MLRRTLILGALPAIQPLWASPARRPPRSRAAELTTYIAGLTSIGDFTVRTAIWGAANEITGATITLEPNPSYQKPLSVLQVLEHATGFIEPVDPDRDFVPVERMLGNQPIFRIISISYFSNVLRIRGDWWFWINRRLIVGAGANVERTMIAPRDVLHLTLAYGTRGKIV